MPRSFFALPLILLFFALSAAAEQPVAPKISVNVDTQPLIQGEPFSLTFHIESSGRGEPEIKLPRLSGFRILGQSESHPMSFQFSFGMGSGQMAQTRQESNYTFEIVADRAGVYKIDPVVVNLDGRQYRGNAYSLQILSSNSGSPPPRRSPRGGFGNMAPLPPQQPTPNIPDDQQEPAPTNDKKPSLSSAEMDGAKIDANYFIQTSVSSKKAVVGEPIILTIYLYTTSSLSDLDVVREPGTEGFWIEDLLPPAQRITTEAVDVNGQEYQRAVLRKKVLFPIKSGTLTIAPTLAELEISPAGFFSRRRTVKRASLPVQISVDPLPSSNQPAEFNPANVGRYAFKAEIDRSEVKTGEPITLTLTARGEGNVRNLVLPEFKDLDGFKIYAPETDVNVQPQGNTITGTRSNRILMIPQKAGEYSLPEIAWSYFDPEARSYKSLKSRAQKISVRQGQNQSPTESDDSKKQTTTQTTQGQDRLNRKLRSILSRADLEINHTPLMMTQPWFIALALGAPLIYLAIALGSRTRQKLAEQEIKGRSKRADTRALKRLHQLNKTIDSSTSSESFFAELARLLTDFLEERLEAAVAGDTMTDLRTRLLDRGFSLEQAEQVVTEIESCDFARFARSTSKKNEHQQALERMEKLIRTLASVRVVPPPKETSR